MSIIFHQVVESTGGRLPLNVDVGPIVGGIPSQGLILNSAGEVEAVLDGTVDHFSFGLPFDANSRLCVTSSPVTYIDQGIPFASNSNIAVDGTGPADYFNQGLAYKNGGGAISVNPINPMLPTQVQNLALSTPTDNEIDATWDANPAPEMVTSYTLEYKPTTSGTWIPINVGLVTSFTITGLASGVTYDVRVYATNVTGDGPTSVVMQATVTGVPEQITDLAASSGQIEQSNLTWTPPTASPAASRVDLHYRVTGTTTWFAFLNIPTSNTNQIIYDLQNAGSYDFRIRYANATGNGAWSSTVNATPTQIGSPLVLEINNKGFRANESTVQIWNTGTTGAGGDFGTEVGGGAPLSNQTRKIKDCYQAVGDRALRANSVPQPSLGQPGTIIWTGIPFLLMRQILGLFGLVHLA